MTTREKVHKLVDELPDSELEPLAEILASRGKDGTVDDWSDLDAMLDAAAGDLMADLDKEEVAASGETSSSVTAKRGKRRRRSSTSRPSLARTCCSPER
jgi:hypothetical protein